MFSALKLVFEGPVKSYFLAQNGLTVTVTGLSKFQEPKKTRPDRLRPVNCGFYCFLTS